MTICTTNAPAWWTAALHEIGTRELPENRGPAIRRYIAAAHCGNEGDPWCAIFANAMLEMNGIRGTRSAGSQSFRLNSSFIKMDGPALGAICVFWRVSRASGLGHVGFYRGESADGHYIMCLGGNEQDMVQIEPLPANAATFGLWGYYWPRVTPLPEIGKIIMPSLARVTDAPKVV